MIVEFVVKGSGVPIYINPDDVMTLRPDAEDPTGASEVKLRDGEVLVVLGSHDSVAARLAAPPAS